MAFGIWEEEAPKRKRIGDDYRDALFTKQKGKCMYCGRRRTKRELHIDHKNPVARGGSNSLSNLQLLCSECNTRKGKLTDGEFRRRFKLTPSRQAKGPPTKAILQSHFRTVASDVAEKKTKKRRRREDDLWSW